MTLEQTPAAARTDVRRSAAASGTTTPTRPFFKRGHGFYQRLYQDLSARHKLNGLGIFAG